MSTKDVSFAKVNTRSFVVPTTLLSSSKDSLDDVSSYHQEDNRGSCRCGIEEPDGRCTFR